MTRFKVYGEYIELPQIKVTFKRVNSLFGFDELECERTTSFAIPATPKNNGIFGFANDIATFGQKMRVKHPATMENGIIVKDGSIFVTEYNCKNKEYNAIFVCGDLQPLLAIKDAGTFDDFGRDVFSDTVRYTRTPVTSDIDWGCKQYTQAGATGMQYLYPSVSVKYLLERSAEEIFGMSIMLPTMNEVQFMRLVTNKLVDYNGDEIVYDGTGRQLAELSYNLPPVTFFDLVKVVSYVSATAIHLQGNLITFEDFSDASLAGWRKVDLSDKIVSVDKMSRKFKNVQNVYIKTISDHLWDGISTYDYDNLEDDRRSLYHTDNTNLEESEIIEIPFHGGRAQYDLTYTPITYPEKMEAFGIGAAWHNNPQINTIAKRGYPAYDDGTLLVNPFLQNLFAESTYIEVKVRMTLLEYETMQQKSIIYALGQQFVWREIQWSEGFATIKLQKF